MNRVVKSRINLLRRHPFFGRLALLLEIKETKTMTETASTDGELLMYNPDFVNSLTQDELDGAVLHEVLHVALGHLWRKSSRIPHIWNLSADYAVNSIVVDNGYTLIKDGLYEYNYRLKSTEEIYDDLIKNAKSQKQRDCGFGNEESEGKESNKKTEENGCGSCKDHQHWGKIKASPKKMRELKKRWEGTMEKFAKERGEVPSGFERIVEDIEAKEDWKSILMNYMSNSKSDFDFTVRDRRTLTWPFHIPDMKDENRLEDLVVAIDTSGSISPSELNIFIAEIKEILNLFPQTKGWVIDCDAEVNSFVEIDKVKEIDKWMGGGGTSHVPVFNAIKKSNIKPKVALCFTDLYTDFPDEFPDYPVLWLSTPSGDDTAPFGRVVRLQDNLKKEDV